MRYLLFSLFLAGCASEYKLLKPVPVDDACVQKIKPAGFTTTWYNASVTVAGKYISGLLLIKPVETGYRAVFTNEAGLTYFDFELGDEKFKVHHVIKKLDKKPVIQTLRKDFELVLGLPFQSSPLLSWQNNSAVYYGATQKKETTYFITDKDCASLQNLEIGSKRKRKVTAILQGTNRQSPDSVRIEHHTFAMQIMLKKLNKE